MSDFDTEAFLEWLDEQEGPVTWEELQQWPEFPHLYLKGVTGPFVDGEPAYYQHDLRRAARRYKPFD